MNLRVGLAALWFVSVGYMLLRGRTDAVTIFTDIVAPVLALGLAWLSTRFVPAPPGPLPIPRESRPRLIVQLCIIAVVILTTGIGADSFVRNNMPGEAVNFIEYALVPGLLVLMLGGRLPEMGFARFAPRTGRLFALWLAFPAAMWLIAIVMHRASFSFMLVMLVHNLFSNGVSEEFLFRGLLLTRLRALIGTDVALLSQAAVFGLWHFRADVSQAPHHDLALTFADMIASQVVLGYIFGWLFLRTRNIALPSAFHLAFDSIGNAFGG